MPYYVHVYLHTCRMLRETIENLHAGYKEFYYLNFSLSSKNNHFFFKWVSFKKVSLINDAQTHTHQGLEYFVSLQRTLILASPICGQKTQGALWISLHSSTCQGAENPHCLLLSLCSQKEYSPQAIFHNENEKQRLNGSGKSDSPRIPWGCNQC